MVSNNVYDCWRPLCQFIEVVDVEIIFRYKLLIVILLNK